MEIEKVQFLVQLHNKNLLLYKLSTVNQLNRIQTQCTTIVEKCDFCDYYHKCDFSDICDNSDNCDQSQKCDYFDICDYYLKCDFFLTFVTILIFVTIVTMSEQPKTSQISRLSKYETS